MQWADNNMTMGIDHDPFLHGAMHLPQSLQKVNNIL